MTNQNVATLLKEIQINKVQGMSDTIHNFSTYYYIHYYQGTEIPEVFEEYYFTFLKFELLIKLGSMTHYNKQEDLQNFIQKTILNIKIHTYKDREVIFEQWLHDKPKNYISQLLINKYPSEDFTFEVKQALGLNQSLQALKLLFKRLK